MIHYKKCCKVYWFYKEYTRGTPTRKKSRYFIKKKVEKNTDSNLSLDSV